LCQAGYSAEQGSVNNGETDYKLLSPEFQKLIESERLLDEAVSKGQVTVNSYRSEKVYDLLNHPFYIEMAQEASRAQTDLEFDVAMGATSYHTNELGPFLGWEPLSPMALFKLRYRLFGSTILSASLGQAYKVNQGAGVGLGIMAQTLGDFLLQMPVLSDGNPRASFFRLSVGVSGFAFQQKIPTQAYFLQNYWAMQIGIGRVFILTEQLSIGLEGFIRSALVRGNSFANPDEPKDGQGFQFLTSILYRPFALKDRRADIRYGIDLMYRAENFGVSTQVAQSLGYQRLFLEQLLLAFSFKFLN